MARASLQRIEVSRGSPGTPSVTSNLMLTSLFGFALAASLYVSWLWSMR